ncbi:hypothetical protein GALL_96230 [mine drainage metagenome]|uniref:Uncharacterized protein n=1 Tax=mine drainage metagenome TaxID=410659 RepID=A0A1J5SJK4_9ZZZZ
MNSAVAAVAGAADDAASIAFGGRVTGLGVALNVSSGLLAFPFWSAESFEGPEPAERVVPSRDCGSSLDSR